MEVDFFSYFSLILILKYQIDLNTPGRIFCHLKLTKNPKMSTGDADYDKFLHCLQAELNRNSRRQTPPPEKDFQLSEVPKRRKVTKAESANLVKLSIQVAGQEDPNLYIIDDFISVDEVTGHVLVKFLGHHTPEWQPYVYLRWACPTIRDKKELDEKVTALKGVEIKPEHKALERKSILLFHGIVLQHYVPRLNDGTREGEFERIGFRLEGKRATGFTHLNILRSGCDLPTLSRLESFIQQKKREIAAAAADNAELIRIMGLCVEHADCVQRLTRYEFKNRAFIIKDDDHEKRYAALLLLGLLHS